MKKVFVLLAVLLIPAAYVAGLWPERERRLALEREVGTLQSRLEETDARVRLCGLLAESQGLVEAVAQKNYGQAQQLSSRFFDHARAESGRTPQPAFRDALETVLRVRDPVTAALARADAAALEHLKQAEGRLRGSLGYPPPTTAPGAAFESAPAATPSPTLPSTIPPSPKA